MRPYTSWSSGGDTSSSDWDQREAKRERQRVKNKLKKQEEFNNQKLLLL